MPKGNNPSLHYPDEQSKDRRLNTFFLSFNKVECEVIHTRGQYPQHGHIFYRLLLER